MVQQTLVDIHYFLYPLISKRHVYLLPLAKTLVCSFRPLQQMMLIVICGTIPTIPCDKSCQQHNFILVKYQSKLSGLSNISFLLTAHVNGTMHKFGLLFYSKSNEVRAEKCYTNTHLHTAIRKGCPHV